MKGQNLCQTKKYDFLSGIYHLPIIQRQHIIFEIVVIRQRGHNSYSALDTQKKLLLGSPKWSEPNRSVILRIDLPVQASD